METELTAATELWPRNPALAEFPRRSSPKATSSSRRCSISTSFSSQKNYRQIFDDKARFIAAISAQYPDRAKQLKEVLDNMQTIEIAIMQAKAMAQQSNYAGAWESVEKIAAHYPDDNKLSQTRANLTTQAADFVRTLRSAQDLEKKDQVGSSLAWYLKARKLYPGSEFAAEGVDRLVKDIA